MSAVVEAQSVTRVYGSGRTEFTAVKDVSFDVRAGEVFGLLGTNGAGKTSTMELLEGLGAPSGGAIRIFGKDPRRERQAVRPHTGIMLQSGGLPQELTVEETLTMWRGTCSQPTSVDRVLELVDMDHRRSVRVAMLSGGEQRRLDLACALIGRPSLLFLDEPTTGLDPESRRRTWDLLSRLKSEGVTMILTTHYLDEAESLADRLVIMHEGTVRASGTVRDIVASQPAEISWDVGESEWIGARDLGAEPVRGRWRIETFALQRDLHRLLDRAAVDGIHFAGLSAHAASLEQVFLKISADRSGAENTPTENNPADDSAAQMEEAS